jgi:nucleotide-binding universal stress UspA family protein
MSKFERLLAATDFSEFGSLAIRRAAQLAEIFGSRLTVAHAMTDLMTAVATMPVEARWELVAGDIDKFERELRRNSDQQIERLIAPLRKRRHLNIEGKSLTGLAYVEIIHAVQSNPYDIVFVGHRGLTGLRRLLLGSTAERLARHCPAPVWVVRTEPQPLKRILIATDFSDASNEALRTAAAIAEKTRAELDVLHVLDDSLLQDAAPLGSHLAGERRADVQQRAEAKLEALLREHTSGVRKVVRRVAWGPTWKVIRQHARRGSADLIAMGSIGRTGIAGLLLGNIAEKVLRLADRDVLVVKPGNFVSHILSPIVQ